MVDAAIHGPGALPARPAGWVGSVPGGGGAALWPGTQACAAVPLRSGRRLVGSLLVAFEQEHDWRPTERDLVVELSALTGQALDRIWAQQAERAASAASRRLSEALQRSLLTSPPDLDDLQMPRGTSGPPRGRRRPDLCPVAGWACATVRAHPPGRCTLRARRRCRTAVIVAAHLGQSPTRG